ncbi:unnamed protein product [Paramecium sonneborni]|uniref:Transmembrane protein n=1 Tax=Paramecium sonneborni TaxID=65129 RepID=A0A8S1MMQ0_9CILI|nr:unnamed protein product [Paramecium sonneborni]
MIKLIFLMTLLFSSLSQSNQGTLATHYDLDGNLISEEVQISTEDDYNSLDSMDSQFDSSLKQDEDEQQNYKQPEDNLDSMNSMNFNDDIAPLQSADLIEDQTNLIESEFEISPVITKQSQEESSFEYQEYQKQERERENQLAEVMKEDNQDQNINEISTVEKQEESTQIQTDTQLQPVVASQEQVIDIQQPQDETEIINSLTQSETTQELENKETSTSFDENDSILQNINSYDVNQKNMIANDETSNNDEIQQQQNQEQNEQNQQENEIDQKLQTQPAAQIVQAPSDELLGQQNIELQPKQETQIQQNIENPQVSEQQIDNNVQNSKVIGSVEQNSQLDNKIIPEQKQQEQQQNSVNEQVSEIVSTQENNQQKESQKSEEQQQKNQESSDSQIKDIQSQEQLSMENIQDDLKMANDIKQANCIIIYSECEYQGFALEVCNSLKEIEKFKHQIKSLYIPQGYGLTIYENQNFNGKSHRYTQSQQCLQNAVSLIQLRMDYTLLAHQNLRGNN